jgi:MIP family channel proteins
LSGACPRFPLRTDPSRAPCILNSDEVAPVYAETVKSLIPAMMAEFIGSALFIFIACGAAMTTTNFKTTGTLQMGIALTFGWTIIVIAWSIGHISGGHLNFAVTFSFVVLRKITVLRGIMYFIGQFFGGLVGIGLLKLVTPQEYLKSCFASNMLQVDINPGQALLIEAIMTGFLLFVVNAAADNSKSNQTFVPVAIGFAITACHLVGLPITGCSINPTRSFASAAAASNVPGCDVWTHHWVFWLGPLMGGAAMSLVYEFIFLDEGSKLKGLRDGLSSMYKKIF